MYILCIFSEPWKEKKRQRENNKICWAAIRVMMAHRWTCHASCSDQESPPSTHICPRLWFCSVPSLPIKRHTGEKELPFLGSLLLDALIFLEGVICDHWAARPINKQSELPQVLVLKINDTTPIPPVWSMQRKSISQQGLTKEQTPDKLKPRGRSLWLTAHVLRLSPEGSVSRYLREAVLYFSSFLPHPIASKLLGTLKQGEMFPYWCLLPVRNSGAKKGMALTLNDYCECSSLPFQLLLLVWATEREELSFCLPDC